MGNPALRHDYPHGLVRHDLEILLPARRPRGEMKPTCPRPHPPRADLRRPSAPATRPVRLAGGIFGSLVSTSKREIRTSSAPNRVAARCLPTKRRTPPALVTAQVRQQRFIAIARRDDQQVRLVFIRLKGRRVQVVCTPSLTLKHGGDGRT